MMDGIRRSTHAHKRAVNNMEKRQKLELEMMKDNHDANLGELRKSKQADAANIENEHHKELAEKTFEKEKKLETIRKHLEETQHLMDGEMRRQNETHRNVMADKNENFSKNLHTTRESQSIALDESNHNFNVASRNANDKQLEHTYQQETRYRTQDIQQKQGWDTKLSENRTKFSETYNMEGQKFDHLRRQQDSMHKKDLKISHIKNEKNLEAQNEQHVKKEELIRTKNNKSLQDQEVMFEKRYQVQLGRHHESEKNMEAINNKVVEKSKEDLVKRVKVHESRSGDPFFQFTHVKPTITERPDHYVLKMRLPEYAKEEVNLSTNNREVVLTFNRRHKEERVDEDGSKLKVDKVESTVSRIPVSQILDPKKISKEWADGVLTYKIFKA